MVKLNKAALAVLALGVAGVANAAMYAPPPAMAAEEPAAQHGFYVGIGLGGIGFETQLSGQASATLNGLADTAVSLNDDKGNYGLNSYLLGGYAWTFPNKVFLAGEIFGNLTNVPVSMSVETGALTNPDLVDAEAFSDAGVSMTLDGVYGIRALPGYQVTPSSVVYGIIGYARAHAGANAFENSAAAIDDVVIASSTESVSNSYNFNGLQLGLGSMINVTEHVALRGDLIWTGYGSQTVLSGSAGDPANPADVGAVQGDLSVDPTTIEADVGVVYMFD